MAELDLKSAPRVTETVLKRKAAAKFAAALNAKSRKRKVREGAKASGEVKRAETFVRDFRNRERWAKKATGRLRRKMADSNRRETVPADAKLLFVVRIRAGRDEEVPVLHKKLLNKLNLKRLFRGVFVKNTPKIRKQLDAIREFLTWGYPNPKLVQDLIYKRGYALVDGKRLALTDNSAVENSLGDCGIICTEDIVHEIQACGENFKRVSQFLCPFHLRAPNRGFSKQRKLKAFDSGGEFGDRKEHINDLVAGMN
eukprot:Plantae.Rhodophyta-Purpureofilum_apyrenoidigerum.ctg15650.p1 GENE.Plantae.Rhodophyta-Purpureofilum_apyrenoidigerum.ctg15650~~Plantae.Rhodophyta-Purpureofilum_apyrenoidigerum.ctg15650.p1  ORF type:complete len:255 (-),score=60.18 Plantae.Rhodophyta-Purpureofilum_apyrenoidigerum.ctg15650:545-1309(-)